MPPKIDASRHLLFGLLALQNGLIDQGELVAAFQAWTRDKGRPMAAHLVSRGNLDAEQRTLLEALVAQHLKKHGGDLATSLAAIPTDQPVRAKLSSISDSDLEYSLAHAGSSVTHHDPEFEPLRRRAEFQSLFKRLRPTSKAESQGANVH